MMLSRLHLGQNRGKFHSTVFCSSRSRVFAPHTGQKIHFSSARSMIAAFSRMIRMKGAEEDLNMGFQPFKAFLLLFRLAVTDTDQCDDRRHIQQRQRIGILVPDLTGGDQIAEDTAPRAPASGTARWSSSGESG